MSTRTESSNGAEHAGWNYQVLAEVVSTNTHAARLPAWTAIRANVQTGGRGRTPDRQWVSDAGGLWLSAVLPCPGPRIVWETLPLAAGWAVLNAMHSLGVTHARLRWPNDIMVYEAKLAGVLVERYTPETAVVGVGLNVFNRPESSDPSLAGRTVQLSRFVCGDFTLDDIADCVLAALRDAHELMLKDGFAAIADDLNVAWGDPRRVEITLHGASRPVQGMFHGVDRHARLRVTLPGEGNHVYEATQVALFREI